MAVLGDDVDDPLVGRSAGLDKHAENGLAPVRSHRGYELPGKAEVGALGQSHTGADVDFVHRVRADADAPPGQLNGVIAVRVGRRRVDPGVAAVGAHLDAGAGVDAAIVERSGIDSV